MLHVRMAKNTPPSFDKKSLAKNPDSELRVLKRRDSKAEPPIHVKMKITYKNSNSESGAVPVSSKS